MMHTNLTVFYFLNSLAGKAHVFDVAVIFCATTLGILLIIFAILFLFLNKDAKDSSSYWLSFPHRAKEFFVIFISAGIALGITSLLKIIFQSPRPFIALTNVHQLFGESGYAFPSGHATFFSALAMALYLYYPRMGALFGFGALLIGLARIIGGVHFPIDILAGYILGICLSVLIHKVILPWIRRISTVS